MGTTTAPLDNMGGIQKIYLIPVSIIESFADIYNQQIHDFTITEGYAYSFLYVIKETIKFSQEKKSGADGDYYETKLEAFSPADRTELQSLIENIEANQYLVIYQDNNNYFKVIGSPDEPVNISADLDAGQIESGMNGYKITFERKLRFRSPFIEELPSSSLPS
jgi:hypothetical protein